MSELNLLVERRRLGVGETNDDRLLAQLVLFFIRAYFAED